MDETPEFKDGDDALAWMEARLDGSWTSDVEDLLKKAAPKASGAKTATPSTGHSVAQVPHDLDEEDFMKMMGF